MRPFLVFMLFSAQIVIAQDTYYSPCSLHVPTGIQENITQTINVDSTKIVIESDAGNGLIDIQTLIIHSKEEMYDDFTKFTVYHCTSEDLVFPSTVIMEQNPQYITVIQPSRTHGPQDEFRLVLEEYK